MKLEKLGCTTVAMRMSLRSCELFTLICRCGAKLSNVEISVIVQFTAAPSRKLITFVDVGAMWANSSVPQSPVGLDTVLVAP
jgi:hypothetical protein